MTNHNDEPRYGERIEARQAPKYGEYAPPGWVSPVPPPEPDTPAESAATPTSNRAASPYQRGYQAPPPTGSPVPGPAPVSSGRTSFNRYATFLLVGIGLFSVLQSLVGIPQFATSLLNQFSDFGYQVGDFHGQAALQTVGTISAIVSFVVFLIVAAWALRRMRRGQNSWVPMLLAGVGMNVLTSVAILAVLASDPSFMGTLTN